MKNFLLAIMVAMLASCADNKDLSIESHNVVILDKTCVEPACVHDGYRCYHKPGKYDLLVRFVDGHREHQGVSSYTFDRVEIGDTIIIDRYK